MNNIEKNEKNKEMRKNKNKKKVILKIKTSKMRNQH